MKRLPEQVKHEECALGLDLQPYDAAYDALNTEWRKVIVPKIEEDLPYPVEERRLAMKAHELYMKL